MAETSRKMEQIIRPEHIAVDVPASSKKRALEMMSDLLAKGESHVTPVEIFESLLARERLGGTGLGKGVAIPHGRLKGSGRALAGFIRLAEGVDFDAADRQPVDLLFALLVPESSAEANEEYLQVLAELAEMLSDDAFRARLRSATSGDDVFAVIAGWSSAH